MTDSTDPLLKPKWQFTVAVGWVGYATALMIIIGVLGANLWMMLHGLPIPTELANWGTVCLGYLALLISQARDIIKMGNDSNA